MKVLITSIGSNTSIGVVKGLRMAFQQSVHIVGTDVFSRTESAGSAFVDEFHTLAPVTDKLQYENQLLDIIRNQCIDCVVPIHDLEVSFVSSLAEKFPDLTFWAVNKSEVVNICSNKILSNRLAEDVGLSVPSYASSFSLQGFGEFPAIVKDVDGVSSRGMFKASSKDEVLRGIVVKSKESIVQKFIDGGNEYTVDCYCGYRSSFMGGLARRRIETKDGISTKGVVEDLPSLIQKCFGLLERLNYRGAANIQFIIKQNEAYFIEINPRFSGAGILSYKSGFNSPAFTVSEAMGRIPNYAELKFNFGTQMTRHWDESFYDPQGNRI